MRVLERARAATRLRSVWVATDSQRIADAVRAHGGEAVLTRPDHPSGLDRVAEAVRLLPDAAGADPDAVALNIQGDEPFVSPEGLDHLVRLFERPEVCVGTLAAPFRPQDDVGDPNRVKVVLDRESRALYFSRAPIPWGSGSAVVPLLHVGVYGYRRSALVELASLPPSPLETSERLEQLRALWNGIAIHVAVGEYHSTGIDTPGDLARAREQWGDRRGTR